jgi:predicted TIM-barrel fold metal-dependent hydrolase
MTSAPQVTPISRRRALQAMGLSTLAITSGCCCLRPFATPAIGGAVENVVPAILKPTVIKSAGAPAVAIDVHSHFFNASDVTVLGFVEGPVAYSVRTDPDASDLIKALAPLANALSEIAPTAAFEYAQLTILFARQDLLDTASRESALRSLVQSHQQEISKSFYKAAKGRDFGRIHNAIQVRRAALAPRLRAGGSDVSPLNEHSVANALQGGLTPQAIRPRTAGQAQANSLSVSGTLEFVGYMLLYRWMNLYEYSQAYSSGAGAFGIDKALGAMVNFDRWMQCPPRSAYEDQIKVFQLLSKLSGGYMQPLVGYNPWDDIKAKGAHLEAVLDTVRTKGFVGIKLYPPNGFRPLGNTDNPIQVSHGPSAKDLDQVLAKLWAICEDEDIPVMAHTGESMGKDAATNDGANPEGWQAVLDQSAGHKSPIINLGHLGGDADTTQTQNTWTQDFASKMETARGDRVYGDIAYWDQLRCDYADCVPSQDRLKGALKLNPGLADRIMYGSDWLMLAREENWPRYPFDVASATRAIPGLDQSKLFAGNAMRCFGNRLIPIT